MVQLRDENEAKRHRSLLTPDETPEKQEIIVEPKTGENFDDLLDEPESEVDQYLAQVNELQHSEIQETDWTLLQQMFPQYMSNSTDTTFHQVDEAATTATEVRPIRVSSNESVAGVKRKHEATEEVILTGDDSIVEDVRLQAETRAQIAQADSEQLVEPDVELPQAVTTLSSPPTPQRGASLQAILDGDGDGDDDTTPPSPASQPPREPRDTHAPSRWPKTPNAPPNYSPVKTRSATKTKPTSKQGRRTTAGKEPRKQPLSPNALLSDNDEAKQWCICRKPDDSEKMIMCDEPRCRQKWFHFECVGLERSPPKAQPWLCFEHRRMSAQQRERAEELLERARGVRQVAKERRQEGVRREKVKERLRRDKAKERGEEGEEGKGVAVVRRRKAEDEGEADVYTEERRPAKKVKAQAKAKEKKIRRRGEKQDTARFIPASSGSRKHR
ncbi:PHD finger protein ing1 [Didymella heteroderae]|uniref:PHD finger protein ing1 n=1 Tax=Didymella heteroderae TaxID=1769908 RepID=A0A9P4WZ62_9PLEO|nr:PHD finger protein ing1 [Didymella heteroderae]